MIKIHTAVFIGLVCMTFLQSCLHTAMVVKWNYIIDEIAVEMSKKMQLGYSGTDMMSV